MPQTVAATEPLVRLGCFLGVFAVMVLWELLAPRRTQAIGRLVRWPNNLALVVLDTLVVRLAFPLAGVGMAFLVQSKGYGLFNSVPLAAWLTTPAAVILLDLTIYGQHVAFHAVPVLWRLHRMHHADLEFDVTTGVRFHPVEILISIAIKFAAITAIGAPPIAVLLFEVLLNATSMFNHGNVRLPPRLDRVLRYVVVTPEMHRVHHSIERRETDSNFGFNLPWWDRLFGTYRAQPALGPCPHDTRNRPLPRSARAAARPYAVATFAQQSPDELAQGKHAMTRGHSLLRLGAALVLSVGVVWLLTHRQILDLGTVEHTVRSLGIWAPVGFVVLYAAGTVLFFSGALLSLAGGALFGPVWGTVWNLLGATLGAMTAFLLARSIAGEWVTRRVGSRLRRVVDGVTAEGWRFVALMRLVPLVPFNLLNYALGLTAISLPAYILASAICMLPGAVAYTWLGYAGRAAATGELSALRYGLLGLGGLAVIAFLPRLLRRFRASEPAWIGSDELQCRLAAGDPVVVVDVRQPEEFAAPPGHLPGAVNVPLGELAGRAAELAAHRRPIASGVKREGTSHAEQPRAQERRIVSSQPGPKRRGRAGRLDR